MLTIKAHWFNITLISIHACTQEKTQEEKDNLYSELENVADRIPYTRELVILGNLNEKIGK